MPRSYLRPAPSGAHGRHRVTNIELFFDLVFVFVITQVTQLVEHAHGTMDFLRALPVLVPICGWSRVMPS